MVNFLVFPTFEFFGQILKRQTDFKQNALATMSVTSKSSKEILDVVIATLIHFNINLRQSKNEDNADDLRLVLGGNKLPLASTTFVWPITFNPQLSTLVT